MPGLRARVPSGQIDPRCRSGLLTVDESRRADLPTERLLTSLAHKGIAFEACRSRGVRVVLVWHRSARAAAVGPASTWTRSPSVRHEAAASTARLVRSPGTGRRRSRDRQPKVHVVHNGRTSIDVDVQPTDRPFWMVLGQSHNLGWTATAGGRDLGEPTLVDGYANGWEVAASDRTIRIHLEWKPQKVVWASIALSALSVIVCLVLLFWPRRRQRHRGDHDPLRSVSPAVRCRAEHAQAVPDSAGSCATAGPEPGARPPS